MGELRDITVYYNSHLPVSCPCGMKADSFMSGYKTTEYKPENAEAILLTTNIPAEHEDYLLLIKKHFLILAQRYHPDKNTLNNEIVCKTTMSTLNKAYCAVVGKHHRNCNSKTTVTKEDGKVYAYIAQEIITCKHHESVAAYCHPDYLEQWKTLIQSEWGAKPSTIQRGVQFGDNKQSLYISIFNSGTIFIQGNLSLSYAVEHLQRLIYSLTAPQKMKLSKRSKPFREAVKLFSDSTPQPPKPLALEALNNRGAAEASISPTSEPVTLPDVNALSQTTTQVPSSVTRDSPIATDQREALLAVAMAAIGKLEDTLHAMKIEHQNYRQAMQKRLDSLEKDNIELKRSLGPKISYLIQQYNQPESSSPTDDGITPAVQTPPTSSKEETLKKNTNFDWQIASHKSKQSPKADAKPYSQTKPGKIEFQVNKVAIVENIVDTHKTTCDDKIRREIGKHIDRVIIDRITHYPHNPRKLMVQFATEGMRDAVLKDWLPDQMFGSSKVRKPTKQKENTVGVAKGVPLDMNDSELEADLQKSFPGATFYRMTKGEFKEKLRTVKIYFQSTSDLEKAVKDGLRLDSQSQYVRVEHLSWTPHVRHCTNCWRLGHSHGQCQSEKSCNHCGTSVTVGSHLVCVEQPKCRNCSGSHSADQRDKCPAYKKRLEQITLRHLNLQNGS